jgi:hypothetical protein
MVEADPGVITTDAGDAATSKSGGPTPMTVSSVARPPVATKKGLSIVFPNP